MFKIFKNLFFLYKLKDLKDYDLVNAIIKLPNNLCLKPSNEMKIRIINSLDCIMFRHVDKKEVYDENFNIANKFLKKIKENFNISINDFYDFYFEINSKGQTKTQLQNFIILFENSDKTITDLFKFCDVLSPSYKNPMYADYYNYLFRRFEKSLSNIKFNKLTSQEAEECGKKMIESYIFNNLFLFDILLKKYYEYNQDTVIDFKEWDEKTTYFAVNGLTNNLKITDYLCFRILMGYDLIPKKLSEDHMINHFKGKMDCFYRKNDKDMYKPLLDMFIRTNNPLKFFSKENKANLLVKLLCLTFFNKNQQKVKILKKIIGPILEDLQFFKNHKFFEKKEDFVYDCLIKKVNQINEECKILDCSFTFNDDDKNLLKKMFLSMDVSKINLINSDYEEIKEINSLIQGQFLDKLLPNKEANKKLKI